MKKMILAGLALAALAGLSSCSKTSVVNPADNANDGIGFRTFAGASVRGTEFDRTAMATPGFSVAAFGNSEMYFGVTTVKPSDTSDLTKVWNTDGKSYTWPSYELSFYAYANLPTGNTATLNKTTKTIALSTQAKVADQKDIVAAYNKGTRASHETSGVPMYFKHILSQVEVKAKNSGTDNQQYTVKVAGVKIGRIKSAATFTYPSTETSSSSTLAYTDYNYGTTATVSSFFAGSSSEQTLGSTAVSLMNSTNGNFMIIPQETTAWNQSETYGNGTAGTDNAGTYLGILVQIKSKDGAAIYPTDGNYAFATTPLDVDFEPGKKYVITVDFVNGAGFEEPNNTSDTTETTDKPTGVTITSDQPTGTTDVPGKPILGGPIKFTVTVENWEAATASDINMTPTE